ncbi:hypothetical protein [Halarchaeum sp. P4]|uniref:DUF7857 domain-containing protein n=1 Tax=Halarchaeum sp. P4 TaxID=3421639 RepID=UPI003EB9C7BE
MTVDFSSGATERDGVSLVTVILRNDGETRRRVRVANALDAPVLPPRPDGIVADGWDEDGYEGAVGAGETLALGYACRAAARREPCVLARDDPTGEESPKRSVADAVRDLGDPRPPAAGVPLGDGAQTGIPTPVATWFDGVEARVAAGTLTAANERTLAAVRGRLHRLDRREA